MNVETKRDTTTVAVGLVQINNSFSQQNYFPYSIGLLQAYVQAHAPDPSRYRFLLPLYKRLPVAEAVSHLGDADIVAFSLYVWNARISLEIARRVKAARPDCLIVFGGPQVPDRADDFMRSHPFIDVACHGEGEATFLDLLERWTPGGAADPHRWDGVPGISFRDADGKVVTHPKRNRLRGLDAIPSPYLSGVFDPLMAAHPEETWLVLWETNRGCPFSCTFCDWGSATASKVFTFDLDRLNAELEWIADHAIEFVFCCDANFGILPRDVELARRAAALRDARGYPKALSVQNTKNALERAYEVQKILSEHGLNKGVTISLQSVDSHTLDSIKRRNISLEAFRELQRRFTRDRVETYTDVILALPGETYDSFADGVADIMANGQHNRIQFNNLSILPNAEMGDPTYQARFGMVSVESAIVNIHGSLAESAEEVGEVQQLVIATDAMPAESWRRARTFSWMTALLHFDKVLQIPLVLLHQCSGVSYRSLIERFTELGPDLEKLPTLRTLRTFLLDKARDIQEGGVEFCPSAEWLNIFWPADEYLLIKMVNEGRLDDFYAEAASLLEDVWRLALERSPHLPAGAFDDAVRLNKALLKRPFQTTDLDVTVSSNVWDFYRAVLVGDEVSLEAGVSVHHVDRTTNRWSTWDDYCREVIWYGNKKGAYLYGSRVLHREIAGHH